MSRYTQTRPSLLRRIRQSLDVVFSLGHTDDGHTRNFPNPPLQVLVVRRYNVYPVLDHSVDNAVVCICSLVVALESLPSLVTRDPQSNAVLWSQFFQFGHDAGCDDWSHRCVETIHHGLEKIKLMVNSQGKKVGIDQNRIWRLQCFVVLEEEVGRHLGAVTCMIRSSESNSALIPNLHLSDNIFLLLLFFLLRGVLRNLILLQPCISLSDDAFDGRELASLLLDTHIDGGRSLYDRWNKNVVFDVQIVQ